MTKGVVGIHGLGSQTNVWRNMTPFQVRRVVEEGLARHGRRCAPCVSQHAANLLNALLRTYIGVGCADLSGRCLFGVVRIHTGISREIE
jgi:hypothetical protein